ncbi:MAG: ABC transporter permease [Acidobacteriaceae bacterium]|nr:ABC transporter permease [Acidobacteriaceae bacterium]
MSWWHQVKDECRDARGTRWHDDLSQDLRYALRTLWQKPGFTVIVLLMLALGTAATTIMFAVTDGVLLKPLPYPQCERLVTLDEKTDWNTQWGNIWAFTYPNFLDCRRAVRSLDMVAWRYAGGTISQPGEPEYVDGFQISYGLFTVLGIRLAQGRAFRAAEDHPGAAPVVIIGYDLWQRRYQGSAAAIGTPLLLDGKTYTVIGIAPPEFRLGGNAADVFTPIGQNTEPVMQNREAHPGIRVWGRLRPGSTILQAQTELTLIGRDLAAQYPKSNKGRTFIVEPLRPDVGDARPTVWLLLAAVSLVLLIACVNVASLLLARAVSRERELAMRIALGAARGRLLRQCLTESAALSLCGGALGVLLACVAIRPFINFWPGSLPRAEEVSIDGRVLLFALASSLVCGFLFGIAPALRAPSSELEHLLRAGARNLTGSSRRLHSGFVISEIALAVVLLVSAGMLGQTLLRLSAIDPGIDVGSVLTARVALSPRILENPARMRAAWSDILERAHRVPGIAAAATVDTVPMREGNNPIGYWTTPHLPPPDQQPLTLANCVSPEYFNVMRIPLRKGRFFDAHDRTGSQPVAVIDQVMARQTFGESDPLGKHLWIGLDTDPLTIVGVVGHVRYWGPAGDDRAQVRAQLYYPFAQVPDRLFRRWSELMSIAVRTSVPPLSVLEPLRRQIRGETGDQVLYEVNTMERLYAASLARQRFLLLLFGLFAAVALLLASVGIYGVLAYLTGQRIPEFGVRLALGATAGDVRRLVLRNSLSMVFSGVAVGAAAAIAAGRALQSVVEGMQPVGITTFVITLSLLVAPALIAAYIPARRASRIDPVQALREE